jgi:hypothetical protein
MWYWKMYLVNFFGQVFMDDSKNNLSKILKWVYIKALHLWFDPSFQLFMADMLTKVLVSKNIQIS